jgi:hypothetical protein
VIVSAERNHPAPPTWVWLATLPAIALALYIMLHMYTNSGSDVCAARYGAARTAADTLQVDSLVPGKAGTKGKAQFSCGFTRTSARWQPQQSPAHAPAP